MSVGICGYVNYSSDNILEEINFSYFIIKQSIKWKLGCKLGGNISDHAYSVMEKDITKSIISIEIMDTPLDNYADEMCQPTIDVDENSEFSVRRNLKLNLGNLQEFLKSILTHKKVNNIVLYFNYEFLQDDDKVVEIQIDNFKDIMLENYKEKNYFAPFLKIIIS